MEWMISSAFSMFRLSLPIFLSATAALTASLMVENSQSQPLHGFNGNSKAMKKRARCSPVLLAASHKEKDGL